MTRYVLFFLLVAGLATLNAATRPFVLTSVLNYVGVQVVPSVNAGNCVIPGIAYKMGKAITIITTDPVMKAHLDSFKGKKVYLVVEEAN